MSARTLLSLSMSLFLSLSVCLCVCPSVCLSQKQTNKNKKTKTFKHDKHYTVSQRSCLGKVTPKPISSVVAKVLLCSAIVTFRAVDHAVTRLDAGVPFHYQSQSDSSLFHSLTFCVTSPLLLGVQFLRKGEHKGEGLGMFMRS